MLSSVLLVLLGSFLIVFALYDFMVTAFIPSGEGPLAARVNKGIFQLIFRLAGRDGRKRQLNYVGLAIIFCLSFTWILMIWSGFVCIYAAFPESILQSEPKRPADLIEKIYYVGYTLSTLGIGDFVAGNDFWRLFTAFNSFIGLVTITMAITYLVPVIAGAIQKRSLSLYIAALGESPEQIVINSYDGSDFRSIDSQFSTLAAMILTYAHNLLAYPILYHMHNSEAAENIALKLASLDEAVNIFCHHVPSSVRPGALELQLVRRALTTYLHAIQQDDRTSHAPPPPDFAQIERQTGVRLVGTQGKELHDIYQSLHERRSSLASQLIADGWQWSDIRGRKFQSPLLPNSLDEPSRAQAQAE